MPSLKGKTAVISGASKGVGKALARQLAEEGVNLILLARNKSKLETIREELSSFPVQIDIFVVDLSDSKQIGDISVILQKTYQRIDFLINNAGVGHYNSILNCTEEIWDKVINTNLKAVFLLTKAILPNMISHQDGIIVNVSSVMGTRVTENQSIYCTSKFGLEGWTKSLALELKPYGIRALTVNPAMIDTEFREEMTGRRGYSEEEREKMLSPQDVASAIKWALMTDKRVLPASIVLENHLFT